MVKRTPSFDVEMGEPTLAPVDDSSRNADAENKQILSERGRSIDQIKRLYAVIMGFSATEMIKSVIFCIKYSHGDAESSYVYISFGFCFFTLIILFYLAEERFLDKRYLQKDSAPATAVGLSFDLAVLIISAVCFVILSQALPVSSLSDKASACDQYHHIHDALGEILKTNQLSKFQMGQYTSLAVKCQSPLESEYHMMFYYYFVLLYVVDSILQVGKLIRIYLDKTYPSPKEEQKTHMIWLYINILSIALIWPLIYIAPGKISNSLIALIVAGFHISRFCVDFKITFRFYYPSQEFKT